MLKNIYFLRYMELKPTTQSEPKNPVYAYTQHVATIRALERLCGIEMQLLTQDRNKDPVEDVLSQIPTQHAVLYAVLPIDKAVELRQRALAMRLILLQLDAKRIEEITGQPYNPKQEYPPEIVLKALKTFEVRGGSVRTLTSFEDLRDMLQGKTAAVFNDVMRQALQSLIPDANFVKTCDSDCIEINPLGNRPGVRISFPGTVGQLNATQMAELIRSGKARIYYAEIETVEVPPCLN
jgi:hypothetical protein